MAAQVGLDQMLGNNGCLGRRTAASRDDAVGKRTQPDVVDDYVWLRFAARGRALPQSRSASNQP